MTIHNDTKQAAAFPTKSPTAPSASALYAAVGLIGGLGAVAASSCCLVPMGLLAIGAGTSVLGSLNYLADMRLPVIAISAIAVTAGWGTWLFKRRQSCYCAAGCTPNKSTNVSMVLLSVASMLVLTSISWPYIEPFILRIIRGH